MIPFWFGVKKRLDPGHVSVIRVRPPKGHTVELTELHMLSPDHVNLVDGKIGDDLLPFDGPLDIGFFQGRNSDFMVGSITHDCPLKLYVQANPTEQPMLHLIIKGRMDTWDPGTLPVDTRKKAVEEIQLGNYFAWLKAQGVPNIKDFTSPIESYLRGEDLSDAQRTPGYAALTRFVTKTIEAAKGTPLEQVFEIEGDV